MDNVSQCVPVPVLPSGEGLLMCCLFPCEGLWHVVMLSVKKRYSVMAHVIIKLKGFYSCPYDERSR